MDSRGTSTLDKSHLPSAPPRRTPHLCTRGRCARGRRKRPHKSYTQRPRSSLSLSSRKASSLLSLLLLPLLLVLLSLLTPFVSVGPKKTDAATLVFSLFAYASARLEVDGLLEASCRFRAEFPHRFAAPCCERRWEGELHTLRINSWIFES